MGGLSVCVLDVLGVVLSVLFVMRELYVLVYW